MSLQKIYRASDLNRPVQKKTSRFAPRPFSQPGAAEPAPREELDGTQWTQRIERASRFGPKLAHLSARRSGDRRKNDTGLPDKLKSGIENLSGLSLDDVKVHYNSAKPARLQAWAYTQGREIHVGPGQEQLLAHEAWHVVQQRQGRVRPTLRAKGVGINDDVKLEHEADVMGAKAERGEVSRTPPEPASGRSATPSSAPSSASPIQGGFWYNLGVGAAALTGVGALAYGGYRYYRHRRREKTLEAIRNEQAAQNITEIRDVDHPSFANVVDGHAPQDERAYRIDINRNDPVGLGRTDPKLERIAELHERTHVSADMAYSSNRDQSQGWTFHGDPNAEDFGEHMGQQEGRMTSRLQSLEATIKQEKALTDQQRQEMLARVNYALGRELLEYDPVVNELLAYTKEYGIRANSRTTKALVELARENLGRRRPGGPHLQGDWPR
jgi:Domain of unknown function (DUF4157)